MDQKNLEKVKSFLKDGNIYNETVATVQKDYFEIKGELKIHIKDLFKVNNKWYNSY